MVPGKVQVSRIVPNPHTCENRYQIITDVKNWYLIVTDVEELESNAKCSICEGVLYVRNRMYAIMKFDSVRIFHKE